MAFQEIIGLFISHLKQMAEKYAGCTVDSVVLGRPVHFVDGDASADNQAQDTLEQIARAQSFKNISFQYEPVAAALDYEQGVTAEELALIIDIGGGTSDFSVVRVSPDRRGKSERFDDVLSNSGVHIGGTDFDKLLSLNSVMPLLGYKSLMTNDFGEKEIVIPTSYYYDLATWQKINFLYNNKTVNELAKIQRNALQPELIDRLLSVIDGMNGHKLAMAVEGAKISLTGSSSTSIDLGFIDKGLEYIATIEGLHISIEHEIVRLKLALNEALTQAGVSADAIGTVFLTGGSTAIPLVKSQLLSMLKNAKVVEGDRFGSIGVGLAVDAKRRYA